MVDLTSSPLALDLKSSIICPARQMVFQTVMNSPICVTVWFCNVLRSTQNIVIGRFHSKFGLEEELSALWVAVWTSSALRYDGWTRWWLMLVCRPILHTLICMSVVWSPAVWKIGFRFSKESNIYHDRLMKILWFPTIRFRVGLRLGIKGVKEEAFSK